MTAKVIPIRPVEPEQQECHFKLACPVYLATADIGDPIAAIYTVITKSGMVLDGAYQVKPSQVEALLDALDRLTLRLHQLMAA